MENAGVVSQTDQKSVLVAGAGILLFFAIALGIAMPLVEAVVYPTYFTMMERPSIEISRIIELPYVLFEIGFILWAGRNGFDLSGKLNKLPRDIAIAAFVLLLAIFVSSAIIATNKPFSMTHALMWIVHLVFAMAVHDVLVRNRAMPDGRFLFWHGVGLAILALYTAYWFLTVPPADTLPFGEIRLRGAVPGWIDVRHFGSWTGAITAGFAIAILYGPGGKGLWWARLLYLLSAGLTVWTGTRAAILAVIVITLVFLAITRRLPEWRRIVWAAAMTMLACALAYLLLPDDPVFHLIKPSELESASNLTRTRWMLWSGSIEVWLRSPWFGLGSGSIFWEYAPDYTPTQPHNVIIQFLMSWGVVGAAAGLWILLRAIRAVHKAGRSLPITYPILAMVYALLFQSLLEGMLHYPRFIVSIMVGGAIVLAAAHATQSRKAS